MIPRVGDSGRWRHAIALFAVLAAVGVFSIGLRASRAAEITGDEPFYLLTTESLLADGDLDLREQYAAESWRSFFDHHEGLWRQSVPRADGVLLSPHNPGLSFLVIPGFAVGGLRGAQVQLLLLHAAAFALGFVLADRITGRRTVAWWCTLAVGVSATAFVYATEIYPEAPAALALVGATLVALGPPLTWRRALAVVVLCSAIPWLGVKYAPLAVLVAAVAVWRADRPGRLVLVGLGAASAAVFVAFHVATFGGVTPYGLSSAFPGASTGALLDEHLGVADRLHRLPALWVDRRFGVGRWAPVLLLAVPGAALAWRNRRARLVVGLLATQIAIATFVAITMMGWWFPGRTLMTAFPLLPVPISAFVLAGGRVVRWVAAALGAWGAWITAALVLGARRGEVTLAVDPFDLAAFPFTAIAPAFPSFTSATTTTAVLTAGWLAIAVGAWWLRRQASRARWTPTIPDGPRMRERVAARAAE